MLLALLALLLPFGLIVALGTGQPPRIFVAEPIAFAGLLAMALGRLRTRPAPVAGLVATILLGDCFIVSRLFHADAAALDADRLLGSRIVQTIYATQPEFDAAATPVYLRGGYASPNVWRGRGFDTFGASFFSWDGGNPVRIGAFLKAAGIADLRLADSAAISRVRDAAARLPAWPNPHAVRMIDGVMVVRLGE